MRLAAIINVWDDWDLLDHSYKHIQPLVDDIIVIASEYSNSGEFSPIPDRWHKRGVFKFESKGNSLIEKETSKRNHGIVIARHTGFTHFLTMDADEFYDPDEFNAVKQLFHVKTGLLGIVCPSAVYFRSPKLSIGRDRTLVPFIHRLTPGLKHGPYRRYPYAYKDRGIVIDPTRQLNINSGIEYTEDVTMHHYSWVRRDYQKKIRNSTARHNLERSCILKDLKNALQQGEGYFCEYYGKPLVRATVDFGIPEYESEIDHNPVR